MPVGKTKLHSARAVLLRTISPALRLRLRKGRDVLRRLEARVRVRLPQAFGGPFAFEQLNARRLTSNDRAAFAQLRAAAEPLAQLESTSFFGVGLFLGERLIAVGFCRALGPTEHPFQRALLYAGFVSPRLRRRQLGRALHRARIAQLQAAGAEEVFAWVEPHNAASLASLRACGFREVPQQALWGQASPDQVLLRWVLPR